MTDKEIPHTLVLELDPELINLPDFDPTEYEEWIHRVVCPYAKDDPDRPCSSWYECEHQEHNIENIDPCDKSTSGQHRYIRGTLSYLSDDCWVQICEFTPDEIWRLIEKHKLTLGEHKIIISDTDESHIELELVTGE